MSIRVGVNGLGRVGRTYLRRAAQSDDLEVVAVNDVADATTLRNLLRRDSTFGRFDLDVELDGGFLVIDGRKVAVSALPGLPRRDRGQLVLRLDSAMTQSFGSFVKVFGWYDNEWGYTCRLADLTRLVGHDLAA